MKLRTAFALATATFFAVTGRGAAPAATSTNESATIKAERLRQNAAIAKSELATIATFWTDDVTICRGLGIQMAGKSAYLKLFENDTTSPARIVYERLPNEIEVSAHWPLAFETGVWAGHLGDSGGPVVISGRYSAQWVKRGERWLIRAEVYVALDGTGSGLEAKATP